MTSSGRYHRCLPILRAGSPYPCARHEYRTGGFRVDLLRASSISPVAGDAGEEGVGVKGSV